MEATFRREWNRWSRQEAASWSETEERFSAMSPVASWQGTWHQRSSWRPVRLGATFLACNDIPTNDPDSRKKKADINGGIRIRPNPCPCSVAMRKITLQALDSLPLVSLGVTNATALILLNHSRFFPGTGCRIIKHLGDGNPQPRCAALNFLLSSLANAKLAYTSEI